ncbi:MAG: TolC family protein [Nitrospiraceae bacterium]|nr:TolC family protein [Nitrospiraceae bacterium]
MSASPGFAQDDTVEKDPGAALPPILDLETAQRTALESNPSIEAALARVEQAKARVRQAQSAYFPQIDFTASASKTWLSENDYRAARNGAFRAGLQQIKAQATMPATASASPLMSTISYAQAAVGSFAARAAVDNSVDNYTAALQATWLLFDGFGRKFNNAMARFGHKEFEAGYHEVRRQLLQGVARAFYNVQLQRENIAIAEADQAFNRRLLKEAKLRRKAGAGSLSEELNFEVLLRRSQASRLATENAYAVARIGLAALMGLPDAQLPESVDIAALYTETPGELDPPGEPSGLITYAQDHRPDLIQSGCAVERAQANIGANRALFYPTVSAIASRNSVQNDQFQLGEDDFSSTVGVNVSYTLFAGGRNRARYAEAKAARKEAARGLDSLRINVASEIRETGEGVSTAQEQLLLQRTNAGFVQRNRDLVEKEYKAGQASLVRLNDAQRQLVQAQSQLAAARVSLRMAWYALRTATAESLADWDE